MTDDLKIRHVTLATCYQLAQSILKIGSVVAERVGQGEVGGCHPPGDSTCMVVVVAGCRKALVGTGQAISLLCCTNRCRECSSHFVGTPFLEL